MDRLRSTIGSYCWLTKKRQYGIPFCTHDNLGHSTHDTLDVTLKVNTLRIDTSLDVTLKVNTFNVMEHPYFDIHFYNINFFTLMKKFNKNANYFL